MILGRVFRSVFLLVIVNTAFAAPVATYYEPVVFHDVAGPNQYPTKYREKATGRGSNIALDFTPYYKNIHGAKNETGTKVPVGDIHGRWNLIGLLHGTGAAPGGNLTGGTTPRLNDAYNLLAPWYEYDARDQRYTDTSFTDTSQQFGYFTVPVDSERIGVRAQIDVNTASGIGISIKGGFSRYRQSPDFRDLTGTAEANTVGYQFNDSTDFENDKTLTQTVLMDVWDDIAGEINLNIDRYTKTDVEDVHVALYWHDRFGLDDEEGNHAVTVIPHIEVGAWLPTGAKKNQDIAFSMALGNDGFYGITGQIGLNIDFHNDLQLSMGGSIAVFDKKRLTNYRVPSSESQSGVYPWATTVYKRPGISWQMHAGVKAEDFVGNLSGYFTYIFAAHERDHIKVITNPSLFFPNKLERESTWVSQVFHAGLDYKVVPKLLLGGGIQSTITGKKTYKATTLFGNIRFLF